MHLAIQQALLFVRKRRTRLMRFVRGDERWGLAHVADCAGRREGGAGGASHSEEVRAAGGRIAAGVPGASTR